MKTFDIKGILKAASHFSREEGADQAFELSLRGIESTKQEKLPEEVTTTDERGLYSVFSLMVAEHCLSKMVSVVIAKYEELGYVVIQ